MDWELEKLAGLFKFPDGDDVTEEQLTRTVLSKTIDEVKKQRTMLSSPRRRDSATSNCQSSPMC
jgi:hypothetical protein